MALWLALALLLGALQAANSRYAMNPDGIAYLDMADAYARGDWATAIRSHWSPLYALLLAAVLHLTQPAPDLEFPLVHLANLLMYGGALAAYTFLLLEIRAALGNADTHSVPPEWAWLSFGYAVFVWCTLQYTPLGLVTPDLLVSAVVYAIAGVILRMRRRPSRSGSALLGGLLGLGYLAKAPMLPLAFVFLAASALVLGGRANRILHLVIASIALAVVALPFIIALSVANGRPTVGDSAMLNYLWLIDDLPKVHWQGGPDGIGQPLHHSQALMEQPSIFAFESPFPVTYAPWYAPEYWFVGATPVVKLEGQLRALLAGLQAYTTLAPDLGVVCACLAILLSMRSGPWRITAGPAIALLAPAIAAAGMYALVLVEARYIAPFVVLLILGLLMLVQLPNARWGAALAANGSVVMLLALVLQIGWLMSDPAGSMISQLQQGRLQDSDEQAQVASALRFAGIRPGDAVASGNRGFNAYWARLARVRIVAEVSGFDGGAILEADPAVRTTAQRLLLAQKVRALVARGWPAQTDDPGWQPIEGTDYFYYLVPREAEDGLG